MEQIVDHLGDETKTFVRTAARLLAVTRKNSADRRIRPALLLLGDVFRTTDYVTLGMFKEL